MTGLNVDRGTGAVTLDGGVVLDPAVAQSDALAVLRAGAVSVRGPYATYQLPGAAVATYRLGRLWSVSVSTDATSGGMRRGWGSFGVFEDPHYPGERSAVVSYAPQTTAGPPPLPGDLDALATARRVAFGPVGDAWECDDAYLAFERLLRVPPPQDDIAAVVRGGTAAGRVYAAHLLDRPEPFEAMHDDTTPLTDVAELTTLAAYSRLHTPR